MNKAVRYDTAENIGNFLTAEVVNRYPNLYIRLIDYAIGVFQFNDLCLIFKNVQSFMVNEEFVRPLDDGFFSQEYPISIVENSEWLREIVDEIKIRNPDPIHFRITTDFPIIDVASSSLPIIYNYSRLKGEPEIPDIKWLNK